MFRKFRHRKGNLLLCPDCDLFYFPHIAATRIQRAWRTQRAKKYHRKKYWLVMEDLLCIPGAKHYRKAHKHFYDHPLGTRIISEITTEYRSTSM